MGGTMWISVRVLPGVSIGGRIGGRRRYRRRPAPPRKPLSKRDKQVLAILLVVGLAWGAINRILHPPGQPKVVAAGVPVQLFGAAGADIEVTAGGLVDPAALAAGQSAAPTGQRYVTVQLLVADKGFEPYSPDLTVDFGVEDSGRHLVGTLMPTAGESSAKVAAGASLSGSVTFLVPDGVRVARIVYAVDGLGTTGPVGVWTLG